MRKAPKISSLSTHYVPAKAEGDKPNRLLVVLHGLGDSLEGYSFLPSYLDIPWLGYLLVNAPDPYFTGYSWFDIYGDKESGIIRSRKLLATLFDELAAQGFPTEHTGVFGFSQGCLMALDAACRYPEAFGAVVGVSGFVGFSEEYPENFSTAAVQQRILVTHGTQDPLLPLHATRKQIKALQGMGLSIAWKEYQKVHTIDAEEEIPEIRKFLQQNLG